MSSSPTDDDLRRQLDDLRANLHDLAGEQRRQQQQFNALAETLEASLQPGSSSAPTPPPPRVEPPRKPLPQRALRYLLRLTVGNLRRLWRASHIEPPSFRIEPQEEPAETLPTLTFEHAEGAQETTDYLALPGSRPALPRGALWLSRLTLACEPLGWLDIDGLDPEEASTPRTLRLVRREFWHPEKGLRAPEQQSVIGRTVTFPQRTLSPLTTGPRARRLSAEHWLWPETPFPTKSHPRTPPPPLPQHPRPADHKTWLVVLDEPPTAGRERCLASLLRWLETEGHRTAVASLAPSSTLAAERLLNLEGDERTVYPIGDFLTSEYHLHALYHLAAVEGCGRLLYLCSGELAKIPGGPETLDVDPAQVPLEIDGERYSAPALSSQGRVSLRERLGLTENTVLAVLVADLVAEERVEDLLHTAHRLREDPRFAFLLVGRGPRDGTLGDLRRMLDLSNVHHLQEVPELDLLAAADVVLSHRETRIPSVFPRLALACGKPVLAAAGSELGDLLGEHAVPAGDFATWAEALRKLAEPESRETLASRGAEAVPPADSAALRQHLFGES